MYHYQKNIGDYRSATMHLSLLEHGVYNQLLDWYYLDEQPLPLENRTLFRRLSARSEIEQQAVLDVLAEMFTQTEHGWVHKRVEREIAQYKAKSEQAREAGRLGGRPPKKGVGSAENRDGFENKPDAKPTANQEPRTREPNTPPLPPHGGVVRFEDFWSAWPTSERKQDKVKCAKKWRRDGLDAEADAILADLAVKRQTQKWQEGYIEAPLVYLNGRRWCDGVVPDPGDAGVPAALAGAI
jgi:uncharacterized protein YdaU (DUF1376 family)